MSMVEYKRECFVIVIMKVLQYISSYKSTKHSTCVTMYTVGYEYVCNVRKNLQVFLYTV